MDTHAITGHRQFADHCRSSAFHEYLLNKLLKLHFTHPVHSKHATLSQPIFNPNVETTKIHEGIEFVAVAVDAHGYFSLELFVKLQCISPYSKGKQKQSMIATLQ